MIIVMQPDAGADQIEAVEAKQNFDLLKEVDGSRGRSSRNAACRQPSTNG